MAFKSNILLLKIRYPFLYKYIIVHKCMAFFIFICKPQSKKLHKTYRFILFKIPKYLVIGKNLPITHW